MSVSVSEDGAVLSGTPGSTATFGAGSAEATLSAATDDDSVAEADGRVTASVVAGSGYEVAADAASAGVDVYDNDEAATTPTTAVETLWTSTLTVESIGGVLFGTVGGGNALSPEDWSEDGQRFEVEQLYYFPQFSELVFGVSAGPPQLGQLTLHLDDVQMQLSGVLTPYAGFSAAAAGRSYRLGRGGATGPCSRWRSRAATVRRTATHNPPPPPPSAPRIAGRLWNSPGLLPHQKIARPEQHAPSLLFLRLHSHKAHGRPRRRGRWSKLDEWLAHLTGGAESGIPAGAGAQQGSTLTGAMPYG